MSALVISQSVRKIALAKGRPISLGISHQVTAAALGYKSLASLQAAQKTNLEASTLDMVCHVVLDINVLCERAKQCDVPYGDGELAELVAHAIRENLGDVEVHYSQSEFEDYLQRMVEDEVSRDEGVSSAMANANFDGVEEIYVPVMERFEDGDVGSEVSIEFAGHVKLGLDLERPYTGHLINVQGALETIRCGRNCYGEISCKVSGATLGNGYDEYEDGEPPVRSAHQAYAELLGLDLHEVGDMVDVEPEAQEGHSGEMVYSYVLDFTELAGPEIARKILLKHDALRIEVHASFFDGVRSPDWPR